MVRSLVVLPTILAMYDAPSALPVASLWTAPTDLADRDLVTAR